MAPISFKNSPPAAQDARMLVREAMRASAAATLASAPPLTASPLSTMAEKASEAGELRLLHGRREPDLARVVCLEEVDGKKWKYVAVEEGSGKQRRGASVRAVPVQHSPMAPVDELVSFIRSYVVPEGFPHSVTPSYVPYMTWRALKYFFGGAMSVFTTQSLLNSVGISRNTAASGAVAINWVLKDGAGRVGKMLFARQGKKFDYDLKQLRFAGDLLMEIGAGVELVTAAAPHLFLPLACAANVAKNVAAVTSTSTRTPIYKAYAKGENIGDVTAKGECVANIADLLGTGLSILISKKKPSLAMSFALLSCGYLFSSYQEVKSVVLNTLNRARFSVAVESYLKTGLVPSLVEGNYKEHIFDPPWAKNTPVVLGSRFGEAFQDADSFLQVRPLFEEERYIITYNPTKNKVYALLKDKAESDDILKAAFHAHVLHFIFSSNSKQALKKKSKQGRSERLEAFSSTPSSIFDLNSHISESCDIVSTVYENFKGKAAEQGWVMSESLLNPGRARLLVRT
ncbi:root UVB sensitive protein (Protein of unknown function, DUF647) [Wolffia australiana]